MDCATIAQIRFHARWLIAVVPCLTLLFLVGCGASGRTSSSIPRTNRLVAPNPTNGAAMPQGCAPPQIQARLGGFLAAINSGKAEKAMGNIASPSELETVTIYYGRGSHADRFTARTPRRAYTGFAQLVEGGDRLSLLRAMAASPGPFAPEHSRATGRNTTTAGVQFVLALGRRRSASGKFGIDCQSGQFYEWVMDVVPGIQPEKLCGAYARLHTRRPVFCVSQ